MEKVSAREKRKYIQEAANCAANQVYPLSIAEGFQEGDIFRSQSGCLLFWHYSGFAYLSGKGVHESWQQTQPSICGMDQAFLEEIYRNFFIRPLERRFLLITEDDALVDFYRDLGGLEMKRRVEFRFENLPKERGTLDWPFSMERISEENFDKIHGRIIPSFSWDSRESFLEKGFGFVIRNGEEIAALAFSAAVSSTEVDIGLETDPCYRRRGFASKAALRMCQEILDLGKKPVWAAAETNAGSMRTAESAGFLPERINTVIRRAL